MDTDIEAAFNVFTPNGLRKFKKCTNGLYFYHAKPSKINNLQQTTPTLLATVEENKKLFTKKEVTMADAARDLSRAMNFPTDSVLKTMLNNHMIPNCPVTADGVDRATTIYGNDVAILKGKSERKAPHKLPIKTIVEVPPDILSLHKNVTLYVDIFFVDKLVFLLSISKHIKFLTVQHLHDRKIEKILECLKQIRACYHFREFKV